MSACRHDEGGAGRLWRVVSVRRRGGCDRRIGGVGTLPIDHPPCRWQRSPGRLTGFWQRVCFWVRAPQRALERAIPSVSKSARNVSIGDFRLALSCRAAWRRRAPSEMLQHLEEQTDLRLWDLDPDDPDAPPLHDLDAIIRPAGSSSVRAAVAAWMDQVRRTHGSEA